MPRKLTDWIDGFMAFSEGLPSPPIFRLWSAITGVAGALDRRVWTRVLVDLDAIYPNLYTMLVAPPAVGKSQAIKPIRLLWKATKWIKVAPDSVTRASLVDALAAASHSLVLSPTELLQYNSLAIAADELGVLIPGNDLDFMSVMNTMFDNKEFHSETRRTSTVKELDIAKPQINILGGTQPGFLAAILPETAWSMGFMSRQIMIYSASVMKPKLFNGVDIKKKQEEFEILLHDMKDMLGPPAGNLYGELVWSGAAMRELIQWYDSDLAPVPEHSKLEHYKGRRLLHISKLAIISSISRNGELVIELEDLQRAREWLLEAEAVMPDIFRDMVGKSDREVILEMHYHVWRMWVKNKQQPLHVSALVHFLQTKVPSEKITKIIETAERANIIARVAGTTDRYIPRARHEHGEE